jgi:hypothetical protein
MCFLRETHEPPIACVPLEPIITLEESPNELSPGSTSAHPFDASPKSSRRQSQHHNHHIHSHPHHNHTHQHHLAQQATYQRGSLSDSPPPSSPSPQAALAALPHGLPPPPPLLPVGGVARNRTRSKRNISAEHLTSTSSSAVKGAKSRTSNGSAAKSKRSSSSTSVRKRTRPETIPFDYLTNGHDETDPDDPEEEEEEEDDDDEDDHNDSNASSGWVSPPITNGNGSLSRKSNGSLLESKGDFSSSQNSNLLSLNSSSTCTLFPSFAAHFV